MTRKTEFLKPPSQPPPEKKPRVESSPNRKSPSSKLSLISPKLSLLLLILPILFIKIRLILSVEIATTATATATATSTTSTNEPTTTSALASKQPTTTTTGAHNKLFPQTNQQVNSKFSNLDLSLIAKIPICTLGNDTYQLGERWNPNLPPFGVQVCVQCECTIRQRKSCYESKVACRRITNECPIIDSCPDGKKPVTNPGQCCKSCQSLQTTTTTTTSNSLAAAADSTQLNQSDSLVRLFPSSSNNNNDQHSGSADRLLYYKMNERFKEYQSIIKNLEACQKRGAAGQDQQQQQQQQINPFKLPKSGGGTNKNDLNGIIDSRLAFKSLHDSQSNQQHKSTIQLSKNNKHQDNSDSTRDGNTNYNIITINNNNTNDSSPGSSSSSSKPVDDTMRQDNQHPNDVQQITNGVTIANQQHQNTRFVYATLTTPSTKRPSSFINTCTLGNETFEVGDKWNPDLPPFGIQICVQCNCIAIKQRGKACYETKVNCRRLNNDCPIIETCPDGKKPVSILGQCCKTCQQSSDNNMDIQQQQQQLGVIIAQPERAQKNEKVVKELHSLMKQFPACSKRDGDATTTTTTTTTTATTNINRGNNNSTTSVTPVTKRWYNQQQQQRNIVARSSTTLLS